MRCTNCDYLNPDDARRCANCGSDFTDVSQHAPVQAASAAPATIRLTSAPVIPQTTAAVAAPVAGPVQTVNVIVQAPAAAPAPGPTIILAQNAAGPGCLVRALYFCFIGLWLGFFWTGIAWLLLVSIIGLPLGLLMLNRIPQVMTLKPVRTVMQVVSDGGVTVVSQGRVAQHPFWLRAIYFIAVGWWFSAFWLSVAWGLIGITLGLGLPIAFWMFDRTPAIVTLDRS
ncbi:hypothetical protein [Candidatus Chloroploca sp. Khr17]|uniref:zinc ribbon domain-containing protein n=1 Tax=Candidatus Chloroploca sp. Khr17 TaxID=2496869 RepID=UPI001F0E8B8B|nr:hypothetical protein [Candidatus Chloroploca sp. Khr17]